MILGGQPGWDAKDDEKTGQKGVPREEWEQVEQSLLTVGSYFAVKETESDREGVYHWKVPTDPHALLGTRAGMALREANLADRDKQRLWHTDKHEGQVKAGYAKKHG